MGWKDWAHDWMDPQGWRHRRTSANARAGTGSSAGRNPAAARGPLPLIHPIVAAAARMTSSNFSDLGWALGVCRGVRAFMLTDDGWLTGHYYRQVFDPVEVNTAQCRKDGGYRAFPSKVDSPLRAPMMADWGVYPEIEKQHMLDCACGFYAFYNQSNDYNPFTKPNLGLVSGVIEGFGQVLVGPRGFRAQRCQLVALQIPKDYPPNFEPVIERYKNVPMFTSGYDMVAEFPCEDGTIDNENVTDID